MALSETEKLLLRAMQRAQTECGSRKSVVVLRYALLEKGGWSENIEEALSISGNENPLVKEYYQALCKLALDTPFAEGAGDLKSPAGPRYTECWITIKGQEELITNRN